MIGGLGISTPEINLGKDALRTAAFKSLKEGQVIRAKVLGILSDSKAHLLIGGQKFTAKTGSPLTPGQEMLLKLIREKGVLTLKPVPSLSSKDTGTAGAKEGISLARIAEGLLSFQKLGQESGTVVARVLEKLALKSGERDEGFLPRLLNNGGVLLEKKIASLILSGSGAKLDSSMQKLLGEDLKAALLQVISRNAKDDRAPVSKSSSAALARSVASSLENFQSLNSQPSESHRFLLPFPIMAGDQFKFGQLFLDTGKKEEGNDSAQGDRIVRLAFMLNMTSLGDLRADFSILKKSIAGRFLLQDEATCDFMKSLMPVLGQRMSAIGFQMGRVDCVVAEPSQLAPGALIQSMTAERQVQGLDLVI